MLSRRQFFYLVAAGVAPTALCDPTLHAELLQDVELKKRYVAPAKSYGSGYFGEWLEDRFGLPCYHYTCDQTTDPAARTPVEATWRSATDQTHQVGNDRIVAAVSNYGYIQVRQDEGGPKFLNDYHPEFGLYGAGLGYLTDGEEVVGTYYPGAGVSFDRFFGMGYLRKQATGTNFSVDQTIFAPFGDDPVLISEVTITSQSPKLTNLRWTEYWGCQSYAFAFDAYVGSFTSGGPLGAGSQVDGKLATKLRRDSATRFEHRFERIPKCHGVSESKVFRSKSAMPSTGAAMQEELAANSSDRTLSSASIPLRSEADDDPAPPATFLVWLPASSDDDGPVRFLTDARAFFGGANLMRPAGPTGQDRVLVPEGPLRPAGLAKGPLANANAAAIPDDLSATGPESALILEKPFTLEAGESKTFRFLYGYLPEGFSATGLIAKYRANADGLLAKSSAAWKDEGIHFAVPDTPWVEREIRWHNYYLRSGFTYDDFFKEHIVSQGQVYQYCMGFQGAPRDSLQHALPLVFGESSLAKEVLRYNLKSQQADGSLPYAITGHGRLLPSEWLPSDLDLWLLLLAAEYVLATRDTAFLEERLTTYPLHPGDFGGGPVHTVREKLTRAYRHLVDKIGTGKHGLLRGHNDDWSDEIYLRGVPDSLRDEVRAQSESVMNAAMAAYILDHYARMLRYAGQAADADEASKFAAQQRAAVQEQWAGKWFKRLWFGPTAGWAGDERDNRMWLDGQPWALLGGCASPQQQKLLVAGIDELLRKPSKIGAKQVSKPVDWPEFMPGEAENGGVWAALDGPLIWALAGTDGAMAYDEWTKNSRARHAEVYPDVWYGIWSGPDVYCSADSEHAGQTSYDYGLVSQEARRRPFISRGLSWTAWPVMNMHRHAWPLYSAAKLLGIEFTEKGIDYAPAVPKPEYSFRTKLVGLEKTAKGYQGWYAPIKAGNWTVRIKLPTDEGPTLKQLTVNEVNQPLPTPSDGWVLFTGASILERPLRWSLFRN